MSLIANKDSAIIREAISALVRMYRSETAWTRRYDIFTAIGALTVLLEMESGLASAVDDPKTGQPD